MITALYKIAGITIGLNTPFAHEDDQAFVGYRVSNDAVPDFSVIFHQTSETPDLSDGEMLFRDPLNRVIRLGHRMLHLFILPGTDAAFSWNWIGEACEGTRASDFMQGSEKTQTSAKTMDIYYSQAILPYFESTVGCFNAISIERIFAGFDRQIFHCCHVCRDGEAILFSAPSGGGKSTQGRLWEESGRGRVINGDRAVLERKADGSWIAHGLPIAGSSNIFYNEAYPIRAIIIVEKSLQNRVTALKGIQNFTKVYGQLVTNSWDRSFQEAVMNTAQQIAGEIDIARLECSISQEAVDQLEQYLSRSQRLPLL